ncbi:MAG: NAD(P)-dependent oxidoreductase [Verrucomicrobiota bacterium]
MSTTFKLPCAPNEIDAFLARPTPGVLETLARQTGDVMVSGAGGKMGPTLCLMLVEALKQIKSSAKVLAVSRFSSAESRQLLESVGVKTIPCDLLDRQAVAALPDAPNILFLAGQKFGTTEGPELTWAMNTIVPANVAERFPKSRIVAFSTGCVYSFTNVLQGGSTETSPTEPTGDYPNSCVGREQIFTYFSKKNKTPVSIYRLNYAIDFRYGVLVDVAQKVMKQEPVDVTMGHVNLIWQGDACARAIQCLDIAESPARPINITGPETIAVRALAEIFGKAFGIKPQITGKEAEYLWLNNASQSFSLFGYPSVSTDEMIRWVAAWILDGGKTLNKPTHFEVRDGRF